MDFQNSTNKIGQLNSNNYHYWKVRIQHVLTLKDFEYFVVEDPPTSTAEIPAWTKKDGKAQAIICLSLSGELLENVREVETTKAMWTAIRNVSEHHTLLDKLSARKKFYTATMGLRKPYFSSPAEFVNFLRRKSQ